MAKITISAHDHLEAFAANNLPAFARVYASQDFTNSDDESVGAGSIDSVNYVKQVACTYLAGVTTIASFATTNRIDSTVLPENNGVLATYTLGLYSARGKRLAIVYAGLAIPEIPTTTTWADIALYNQGIQQPTRHAYYDVDHINALLAGLDIAPLASDVIYGRSRLSFLQSTLLDPIAVGDNDPIIRAARKLVYLDTYGYTEAGLTAALAAIGTVNPTELILRSRLTNNSSTYDISPNILVRLEGAGSIRCVGSASITINLFDEHPPQQYFFGNSGSVIITKGKIRLEWWAPPDTGDDSSHAISQIQTSLESGASGLRAEKGTWKFNEFDVPSYSIVECAGSWDGSTTLSGTVFEPFDTASPSYVIGIKEAYRLIALKDFCINVGDTSNITGLLFEGTAPNTGIGCLAENVSVLHSGISSVPIIDVHSIGMADWECTSVAFNKCLMITGEDTYGFNCNTVNTSFLFLQCEMFAARGAECISPEAIGYTRILNCQFRGVVGGGADVATLNRTLIAVANLTIGQPYLDLSSGQFENGDIGQQITSGAFTSTIRGLILVNGLANRALLSANSSINATNQNVGIYRFSPNSNYARAGVHLRGSHTSVTISDSVDEGFQYFAIFEGAQLFAPPNLCGNFIQGRVLLGSSGSLNVLTSGNSLSSMCFEEGDPASLTRVVSSGDYISQTTVGSAVILTYPQMFAERTGTTYVEAQNSFGESESLSRYELPVEVLDRSTADTANPIPLMQTASARIILSGDPQAQYWWGRAHPVTLRPDLGYFLAYEYPTGMALLSTDDAPNFPNRGLKFGATIYAQTFNGAEKTVDIITSDQNNYNPGDSSQFYRMATDATRNITGLSLSATSLDALLGGEPHEFWNVGNFKIVWKHQNASSTTINRFICDTGTDITQSPGERVVAVFDGTVFRWRLSKLNITGLTSDGTTVTSSLPLSVIGVTTIGPTNTFKFQFTPSSATTGAATIGSTANKIVWNEGAGTLSLIATDIDVVGSTVITGSFSASSTIRAGVSIGYNTGSGGTITQITSRTTGVTLNKINGAITLFSAPGSATPFTFVVTNSQVSATDLIIPNQKSGTDAYGLHITNVAAGSFAITVVDLTGTTTEAPVINFLVLKGVTS